ncbi:MAG: hypothetical protein Q4B02_12415 [Propionibacteriaceae bacterium]|nr:hypothetical protein [Propionibacteriaceae bacterium]
MNSFFPHQPRLSRRSFGALGLSVAATLGISSTLAHADSTPSPSPTAPSSPEAGGSGSRLVKPVEGGLRLDSTEFGRLYGPGVCTLTSLSNTIIGVPPKDKYEHSISNRFRALIAGNLQKLRLYFESGGSGYAQGNGGRIKITVLPDDGSENHLPDFNGKPLATGTYVPGLPQQRTSQFPEIAFESSPVPLVKGELYHVVMENTDSNPEANFISSNNTGVKRELGRPCRWLNFTDWSTLLGLRAKGSKDTWQWKNLTSEGSGPNLMVPIMQLTTADGATQGMSDMESGSVDSPKPRTYEATSDKPVREQFKPSADKKISGLSVAAVATAAGNLRWRLLEGSTELAAGQISQPTPDYKTLSVSSYNIVNFVWRDVELDKDVTLKAGGTYDLELKPEGSSRWKFAAHKNGSAYGFTWPAAFTESQAQHLQGGKWLNTNFYDYSQQGQGTNWPVVLHVAP